VIVMAIRRPLNLVMSAMCVVLLMTGAAACGNGGTTTSGGATDAAVQSNQTEESQAAPPAESTGAEQPQSQQNQPAVELAALPVGGSGGVDSSPTCLSVSWTGQALPDGVQFRITQVVVTGDFAAVGGGGGCENPCPGHIFLSDTGHCNAKIAWTKPPGPHGLQGALGLIGGCVAPDAVTCHQVRGAVSERGQAQLIQLTAQAVEPEPGSSSSSEEGQSSAESSSGSSG
jgi:hypothetical protein